MKKIIIKGLSYLTGLFALSFGIDLMIIANQGASAWDALNVGLNEHFGLSIGTWAQVVAIVLILVIAIMMRRRPEISPLLTIFIFGNLIDFHFTWLNLTFSNWIYALIGAGVGLVFMASGIALYLQANFGFLPIDGFAMAIREKTGWSLRVSKTSAELGALTIAFILGGPVGIGTLLAATLIGPMFQFFYQFFQRQLKLV